LLNIILFFRTFACKGNKIQIKTIIFAVNFSDL